jgi:hypothetical protein
MQDTTTSTPHTHAAQALALHRAAAELRERRCHARLRQIALAQYELIEPQAVQQPVQPLSPYAAPMEYGFAQARPAQPEPADEELLQTLLIAGAQALPFGKAR